MSSKTLQNIERIDRNEYERIYRNEYKKKICVYKKIINSLIELGNKVGVIIPSLGFTSLHLAAEFGDAEEIAKLMDTGVDKNASAIGRNGYTPLHIAISRGNIEVIGKLLENGVNVEATGYCGLTPLYLVTILLKSEAVNKLLDAGANKNSYDKAISVLNFSSKKSNNRSWVNKISTFLNRQQRK